MLSHQEAERLLHRYFQGETTLAEETALREYFRAGDVAPELAALDPMFEYWDKAARVTAPAPAARVRRLHQRPAVRWLMATAAAGLLLFTTNGWLNNQPASNDTPIAAATAQAPIDWSKYEVTDPEEAYRLLRGALKTASSEMNRSTRLTVGGLDGFGRVLK